MKVLTIIFMVFALSFTVTAFASGSSDDDDDDYTRCYDCANGTNGTNGADGANGINGTNGNDGIDGINGSAYNDDRITRWNAISNAMLGLPEISHVGDHQHSNVALAVGGNEDNLGVAIGLNHMRDDMSFKGSVGVSGSEIGYSVGAGINF